MEIRHQVEVGDLDFQWMQDYGTAWSTKGCYGEDNLYLTDPKALQYIMHTAGYHYPKNTAENFVNKMMMGRGLVSAIGDNHRRQRKLMNPAFSAVQLRSFFIFFRQTSSRLTQMWKDSLQSGNMAKVINVSPWLSRTTLDIVGDVAFEYQFGALDNESNELAKAFENFFAEASLYPPTRDILFKALWKFIPSTLLDFLEYMPTRQDARRRSYLALAKRIAKQLVEQKKSTPERGDRDIMSILVRSNQSQDLRTQMDEDEMLSQMATIILAGHETTASTLTWMLYELAKHPQDQQKMRKEIVAFRRKIALRGDEDFTPTDLESMLFTSAVIKETLRMHPIAHGLNRYADRDDVIPLSQPILTKSGRKISEIPVSKGQAVTLSICGYNRLPSVWGEDAHEWNPTRFLDQKDDRNTSVGVYGNLLTFSAGVRACIGWRFALFEMQAIILELLENFNFALPEHPVDIQRAPAQVMLPIKRGALEEGVQMPLLISLIH